MDIEVIVWNVSVVSTIYLLRNAITATATFLAIPVKTFKYAIISCSSILAWDLTHSLYLQVIKLLILNVSPVLVYWNMLTLPLEMNNGASPSSPASRD